MGFFVCKMMGSSIYYIICFIVNIISTTRIVSLIFRPYILKKGSMMFTTAIERRRRRRRFIIDRVNNVRSRNAQWYPIKRQDIL